MNDKCWIKIYPPPPIEKHLVPGGWIIKIAHPLCKTLCMVLGLLPARIGAPGVSPARSFFSRMGVAGENFFELLLCSRRKGRNFFLLDSIGWRCAGGVPNPHKSTRSVILYSSGKQRCKLCPRREQIEIHSVCSGQYCRSFTWRIKCKKLK